MSNIDLKVTGVKGGNPTYTPNKGRVVTFIDNDSEQYIAVDAFEGQGTTYKRRKECEIEINVNGQIWRGTYKDLIEKLNAAPVKKKTTKEKTIASAENLLSGDGDTEAQIKKIIAHPDENELIDYIDGVEVWEKVEYSFTVKQFLEQIDYIPSDWK